MILQFITIAGIGGAAVIYVDKKIDAKITALQTALEKKIDAIPDHYLTRKEYALVTEDHERRLSNNEQILANLSGRVGDMAQKVQVLYAIQDMLGNTRTNHT